jgi:hypothetical protein
MISSRFGVLATILFLLMSGPLAAQWTAPDEGLTRRQLLALELLDGMDTTKGSPHWPHIRPGELFLNVRENIVYPEKIYQGHYTNFCGYAALSVILCREHPDEYTRSILELYTRGETNLHGVRLRPSDAIREAAGSLQGKGRLNLNPADQLWLLCLPETFKGYMNLDRRYQRGDENKSWAICTIGKFNQMAGSLVDADVRSWGSDMIRPSGRADVAFIREQLSKGYVVLYVNSKYLHPSKFRVFVLRAPTHYIILYDITEENDVVILKYWDYGLKTLELMKPKRLRKMTFGIIRINPHQDPS